MIMLVNVYCRRYCGKKESVNNSGNGSVCNVGRGSRISRCSSSGSNGGN